MVAASLFRRLDRFSDNAALIGADGAVMTYARMLAAGDRLAAALHGRRVLAVVVCRNDPDCVAGYVGLMRAGAAVVLLHHSIKPDQLDAVVARFSPQVIYAPAQLCVLGQLLDRLGGYVLARLGDTGPALHDDLALLLTTSGTTGSRNFVRLSHGNIAANAASIAQYLGIGPHERPITTLPLSYSYGLSVVHSHLSQGASLVCCEEAVVSPVFWKLMREQAVTSLAGVPFIYDMLKKLRFGRMDLPALKTLTQAGGRMAPDLVAEFAEICAATGRRLMVMYGATEATARMAFVPWEQLRRRPDSIGRAIPGGRLWLEDDAGTIVTAADTIGELVYGGANVSLGMAAEAADLSRGDDNQGVLRTGDMARMDSDGFLFIVGRRKRFLKVFGNRVNLDELEGLLAEAGLECACTGGDDDLVVHVVGDADAAKAVLAARTNLTPHMFKAVAVAALVRQESGKVDYAALGMLHG
ncbi:MAG: AMP-binding protein [Magnetospirillum gryphiswaldense]|nr:AMP-binding protein [Magnetospirillum gryphiswaldense]